MWLQAMWLSLCSSLPRLQSPPEGELSSGQVGSGAAACCRCSSQPCSRPPSTPGSVLLGPLPSTVLHALQTRPLLAPLRSRLCWKEGSASFPVSWAGCFSGSLTPLRTPGLSNAVLFLLSAVSRTHGDFLWFLDANPHGIACTSELQLMLCPVQADAFTSLTSSSLSAAAN